MLLSELDIAARSAPRACCQGGEGAGSGVLLPVQSGDLQAHFGCVFAPAGPVRGPADALNGLLFAPRLVAREGRGKRLPVGAGNDGQRSSRE